MDSGVDSGASHFDWQGHHLRAIDGAMYRTVGQNTKRALGGPRAFFAGPGKTPGPHVLKIIIQKLYLLKNKKT